MRRRLGTATRVCALVLCLRVAALAAPQRAAKVAGIWQVSIQESHGTFIDTLTVTQDGGRIRGELKSSRYDVPVAGTVVGDKIRFAAAYRSNGFPVPMKFTGTIAGDTMIGTETLTFRSTQMELNWTARRRK